MARVGLTEPVSPVLDAESLSLPHLWVLAALGLHRHHHGASGLEHLPFLICSLFVISLVLPVAFV